MKNDMTPMEKAHAAPRCTAHSKRTGLPCKNPAVKGWTVCRLHGAGGGQKAG
ncbi:MAG: HGGxSTG domain-containing protein, partial [Pseudomonadota bacterium]